MTLEEMEIPNPSTVIEDTTEQVFATVSTEPVVDRGIIRQSVIRAFEELGLIETRIEIM